MMFLFLWRNVILVSLVAKRAIRDRLVFFTFFFVFVVETCSFENGASSVAYYFVEEFFLKSVIFTIAVT